MFCYLFFLFLCLCFLSLYFCIFIAQMGRVWAKRKAYFKRIGVLSCFIPSTPRDSLNGFIYNSLFRGVHLYEVLTDGTFREFIPLF